VILPAPRVRVGINNYQLSNKTPLWHIEVIVGRKEIPQSRGYLLVSYSYLYEIRGEKNA